MVEEIVNAMEKCVEHIKSYYECNSYCDLIKLREIEYRLGIYYAYGKILEKLDNNKYWEINGKYWDNIKEYSAFCRKVVWKVIEKGEV